MEEKEDSFRITELRLDNEVFKDLSFSLTDLEDINQVSELKGEEQKEILSPYYTVIIGPNGTGKSYLLRTIVCLFRELEQLQISKKRVTEVPGKFLLRYKLNGTQFTYANSEVFLGLSTKVKKRERIKFYEGDKEITDYTEIKTPNRAIASSIMLTDKFPTGTLSPLMYKYLGSRNDNSGTSGGTRVQIRRTVNLMADCLHDQKFLDKVSAMLSFMKYEPSLKIQFKIKEKTHIFKRILEVKDFANYFEEYWKYTGRKENSQTTPFYVSYFNKIKNDEENKGLIEELAKECSLIAYNNRIGEANESWIIEHEIFNDLDVGKRLKMLGHLNRLDLVTFPTIILTNQKSSDSYDIEKSSSGETHFLTSMISIAATIKQNSLVLIDEPEVSFHPNWQMKYIDFISKNFSEYNSCHIIIATHSHFIISDLEPTHSKILGLTLLDDSIKTVIPFKKELNTYGWSAEDVLYNIFNVYTTRNYYIASKISEIMSSVSLNKELSNMEMKILTGLKKGLKDEDPLHSLVLKVLEKYS